MLCGKKSRANTEKTYLRKNTDMRFFRPLLITFFIALLPSISYSQQDAEVREVQAVTVKLFECFSSADAQALQKYVTRDVQIYEQGVIFTLDTLINYFKRPRPGDFARKNSLNFIQTEVRNNVAYVGYYNTAQIHANGKDREVRWLESAVLEKHDAEWKIKLLHSTRLEPLKTK